MHLETRLLARWHLDIKINKISWFDSLLCYIGANETTTRLVGQASMYDVTGAAVKLDRPWEVISKVLNRNPLSLFTFLGHFRDLQNHFHFVKLSLKTVRSTFNEVPSRDKHYHFALMKLFAMAFELVWERVRLTTA